MPPMGALAAVTIHGVVALATAVALLATPAAAQAAREAVETADLVVSDATGALSRERLERLADQARDTAERVLAFWQASAGTARLGKIHVRFDRPRRDVYSSVFYWEGSGAQRTRVVGVFGVEGPPQMLAHKLTSAVFPNPDKLVRNLMGIATEARVGNPLTFPMCGFGAEDWVLALLRARASLALGELGPDHESWGMKDAGGGRLTITDKARQHRAYAAAGAFGGYLLETQGVERVKRFHRLSHDRARPWSEAFGASLAELEAGWLAGLRAQEPARERSVAAIAALLRRDPGGACAEAQRRAAAGPPVLAGVRLHVPAGG